MERQKQVELERTRSLEQFEHDIQRIQSIQRLAFKETEIRESIRSAKNKPAETLFRQELEFIQTRMIQLEKRYQVLYGLGGLVVGVLGILVSAVFGLLPFVHVEMPVHPENSPSLHNATPPGSVSPAATAR
jgi:hypothetical protein